LYDVLVQLVVSHYVMTGVFAVCQQSVSVMFNVINIVVEVHSSALRSFATCHCIITSDCNPGYQLAFFTNPVSRVLAVHCNLDFDSQSLFTICMYLL